MVASCVLPLCYQVDVLFYGGKPAPSSGGEDGSELAWEWKERGREREREAGLFSAWFLSLIVCSLRFEYALSKQTGKMLQTRALLAFSLPSFLFAIKCISNGTSVQRAFLIRRNSIAFNLPLCNGFAIFEYSYYENCTITTCLWIANAIQLKYCFIEN